jgi:hypothetical protein
LIQAEGRWIQPLISSAVQFVPIALDFAILRALRPDVAPQSFIVSGSL